MQQCLVTACSLLPAAATCGRDSGYMNHCMAGFNWDGHLTPALPMEAPTHYWVIPSGGTGLHLGSHNRQQPINSPHEGAGQHQPCGGGGGCHSSVAHSDVVLALTHIS